MRFFSTIIILCSAVISGFGQISLTSADYPSVLVGADSLRQVSYSSPLPSLVPALGGIWDLTTTTDSAADFLSIRVPVPGYQYGDSGLGRISTFSFTFQRPNSITSTGLFEYGIKVNYDAYSLSSLTAAPFDSLFFPAQTSLYTTPLVKIAFSSSIGSAWQSVLSSDVLFELSLAAFSLSHQQFTQRRFTTRKDTVVGWGKMRVKNAAGAPSPYINVLQVQTATYTIDSFYMGSSVSPGAYLTLLGLTQGKRDTTYIQYYYRKGEVTPLVSATYKDAAFTSPSKVIYHHQRLETVDVENTIGVTGISFYPNPALNELRFVLPESIQYDYMISDISGKVVMSGQIDGGRGEVLMSLPEHMLQGLYLVSISANGAPKYTTKLVIGR